MSRTKHLWIGLLSLAVAAALVYGLLELQQRQGETQQRVRVIAPRSFVPAGTVLDESLLVWRTIAGAAYERGMLTDMAQVSSYEALMPLGEGEPILAWKLGQYALLPARGEGTFQIPKEYVMSVSSGIRAGDRVSLYISSQEGESRRLFERDIAVASVKSSTNSEIDDAQYSNLLARARDEREKLYVSRREANAAIDHVNLNLTEEQWLTIDRLCKTQQYRLVIAFASFYPVEDNRREATS